MALASGTPDGTFEYDHSYSSPGATSQLKMSVARLKLPVCFQVRIPESATLDWLWQKHRKNQKPWTWTRIDKSSSGAVHNSAKFSPAGFLRKAKCQLGQADDGCWGKIPRVGHDGRLQ
jgi:hypothetical protein